MTLRVSRSRGAASGTLLLLLGAWGAVIPFIGPYFSYAYTPDSAWTYNSGRLWLSVLPGAATLVGGVLLMISRLRPVAVLGAVLAAVGGAWFAVGAVLAPASGQLPGPGSPVGTVSHKAMEQLGFFTGLGVVIVFVAALALGRLSIVGVRDARRAEASAPDGDAAGDGATAGAGAAAGASAVAGSGGKSAAARWLFGS